MTQPWRIKLISPAVDFIDNHLLAYHPAFANPPTHYDPILKRYVVLPMSDVMSSRQVTALSHGPHDERRQEEDSATMSTNQFATIMKQFIVTYPQEPKGHVEKGCSIRSESSWEGVLEILQSAAQAYNSRSGVKGAIRRVARFVGDSADRIERVTRLVPDIDYLKPMTGALTILLEVRSHLYYHIDIRVLARLTRLIWVRHSNKLAMFERPF